MDGRAAEEEVDTRKEQQIKSDGGVDGVIAAQTASKVNSPAAPEERGSAFNDKQQKLKRRGGAGS